MNGWRAMVACTVVPLALAMASGNGLAQGGSFPIATSNESEISASVAFDGNRFLVGVQGDAAHNSSVLARFVTTAGGLGGLVHSGRTGGVPFLCYGAGTYLMVWEDDVTMDNHLYGMWIDPSGTSGAPFPISQIAGDEHPAGVAFAGTRFMVAYSRSNSLYGRLLPAGGPPGAELSISGSSFYEVDMNNVASNGTVFLAAWTDDLDRERVDGRILRPDGSMDPVFVVDSSFPSSADPLSVTSDGTDFVVVWGDQVGGPGSEDWDLFARRVSPTGALLGGVQTVCAAPGHQFGPFVAWHGGGHLVTWTDMRNDLDGDWQCGAGEATCWDIYGRYLDAALGPLGLDWPIVFPAGDQFASPIAYGAGKLLMAWTDGPWIAEGGDVYGLLLPPGPVAWPYGSAKTNSQGCTPAVSFSGIPSATSQEPFLITATDVINNRFGVFFYGKSGPASKPFMGGTMLVQPPVQRCGALWSGGNPPPDDCSGVFVFDLNAWIRAGLDPALVAGQQVNGQFWYRDPPSTSGVGLTDAVELVVGP